MVIAFPPSRSHSKQSAPKTLQKSIERSCHELWWRKWSGRNRSWLEMRRKGRSATRTTQAGRDKTAIEVGKEERESSEKRLFITTRNQI